MRETVANKPRNAFLKAVAGMKHRHLLHIWLKRTLLRSTRKEKAAPAPGAVLRMFFTVFEVPCDAVMTMAVPLQISYRNVGRSEALDKLIAHEAAKLERYFGRILNCHVVIAYIHRHQRSGAPYQAHIAISLPGGDVFINQMPDVHEDRTGDEATKEPQSVQKRTNVDAAFKDPALAVRSAFKKARRVLEDRVRLKREPSFRY